MKDTREKSQIYEFGEGYRLHVGEKILWREAEIVNLTNKAAELLVILVERHGAVVSKEELVEALWHDTYVDENNLAVTVSMLRRAFGESAHDKRFIETVPRRGYRFAAPVTESNGTFLIEKHIRTDITIEESDESEENKLPAGILPVGHKFNRRTLAIFIVVAGLGLVLAGAALWQFRKQREPNPVVSNVQPRTIAVLPFKNISRNSGGDESLNIGLTDALISRLANVRSLAVRPLSAVLPFAAENATAQDAGDKLKVENILEGTIQAEGGQVRVSVQLIRVRDNQILWAGNFDEQASNLFEFEDDCAANVSNALASQISSEEKALLAKRETDNSDAYRLYLKGRYFYSKSTRPSFDRAIECFEQAIKLDDQYALAYAALGETYAMYAEDSFANAPPTAFYQKASEAVRKALELNPNLAEAHAILGNLQAKLEWNTSASEKSYRHAIQLNPNLPTAHLLLAWNLIRQSRFAEAENEFRAARELDPTSLATITQSGYAPFFAGDYETALRRFSEALEVNKDFPSARFDSWRALHHLGRFKEAMAQLDALLPIIGEDFSLMLMARGRTLAKMGKTEEARRRFNRLIEHRQKGEYISPILLALLAADLNDRDAAFYWLNIGYEEHSDYLLFLPVAPEFKDFRDDARYRELWNRIENPANNS